MNMQGHSHSNSNCHRDFDLNIFCLYYDQNRIIVLSTDKLDLKQIVQCLCAILKILEKKFSIYLRDDYSLIVLKKRIILLI